ncbi:hypothetical protein V8J82_22715 [Gymnodinialimonas sp. 2305UL16-5]|uniref:hypothetical protein n=1 Tax=Gymnodinialimonas mytili TaxID=3126503 RepID=UPI0030B0C928
MLEPEFSPIVRNLHRALWALGAGSELFGQFTRTDLQAAELWGDQYDWEGHYVDNTSVFHVMRQAMTGRALQAVGQ